MADTHGRGRSPLSLVGEATVAAFYSRQLAGIHQAVLLLGCASGRLAWDLSAHVPSIVAVDPSSAMIASAEEHRLREAAEYSNRLRFISADLRSLRLSDRFAAVLAPQNALGLMLSMDDLGSAIATARHHLLPDGVFIFDAINPARDDGAASWDDPGSSVPMGAHRQRGPFSPHLRERRRGGPAPGAGIRRLRLRQFHPAELNAALEEGGFVAIARYGRYDDKPFDPGDPLQIVVAAREDSKAKAEP